MDNNEELFTNHITTTYRKTDPAALESINAEAKTVAQNMEIDNRIKGFPPRDDHYMIITLEDQRKNFCKHPKYR